MEKENGVSANGAPEIDLSTVANLGAISKKDKDFAKMVSGAKKTNKYRFAEPELIQLPSTGKLYDTEDADIKNGFIRMFPMTIKEEEILATPRFLKTGSATRMVFENCIASDISAKDILIYDSNFLLFRLRQISYGDEYKFKIRCENASCEKEFQHTVNITKLAFEELPEDFEEPIVVKLPRSKYTVVSILPRLAHSEELTLMKSKKMRDTGESDRRFLDNLIITTISILDPKGNEIPEKEWEDFYRALVGEDAALLREKTSVTTGVDKITDVECPYCGTSYSGGIPIGADFFRF